MKHISTISGRLAGIIVETAKGKPEPLSGLKNNQVVDAKILKNLSANRVTLLIMGRKIAAETLVPLKAGETVRLQVSGAGSKQVLRVVEAPSPSSPHAGYLADLKILDRPGPFTHLLKFIKDTPLEENANRAVGALMERVSAEKGRGSGLAAEMAAVLRRLALKIDEGGGGKLKEFIKKSGLIWENKLAKAIIAPGKTGGQGPFKEDLVPNDLKARVMDMVRHTSRQESETVRSLSSFVESLEKLQLLNSHSGEDSGKYLLPFPYISEETLKFGQLFIDKGDSGGRGGRAGNRLVRVAFILEMSHLGNIRADFSILKKAVKGEFQVETPRAGETVSKLIPSLVDELEKKGYTVKKAGCSVVNPLALKGTPLTEMIDSDEKGGVNIVI